MIQPNANPSNILYNGDCPTIHEAFRLMVQQYHQEIAWVRTHYLRDFPDDGATSIATLQQAISTVQACQQEYAAMLKASEASLAAKWQGAADEDRQRLGKALASGDYCGLAL